MNLSNLGPFGIVAAVLILAWVGFEFVFLNGDTIVDQHHEVGVPLTFTVDSIGDNYRITIGREKGGSGSIKRTLNYSLKGPDGESVYSDTEEWARRRRFFTFTSEQSGEFTIYARDTKGDSRGNNTTWIQVDKNDNTLLLRWIGI